MDKIDINGLFLGPKSENGKFFLEQLNEIVNEHLFWRKDFHPEDDPVISLTEENQPSFQKVKETTANVLRKLCAKMKLTSMPWHSPRYLGHMNADILMSATLGYIAAMLYNPNNCAYEASTATTPMELEVGKDFARLMGFDPDIAWGHICTDGTVANMEGLWYARNISSIPFAVKQIRPKLVEGMSDWQLSNMKISDILDLVDKVQDVWDEVRDASVRGTGVNVKQLGKWIVPETKHLSWVKAVDVMGLGLVNEINIQVDKHFRMDIGVLEKTIEDLAAKKIPILGVVGVIGSTEEGAVDHFDKIIALRDKFEKKGISFYVHADCAYGGYARSIFLDEDNNFMPYNSLKVRLHKLNIINQDELDWPSQDVYNAFEAVSQADSATIDPHKMGYVPYSAGGIAIRDKRMVDAISFFAAYIFEKGTDVPSLLGSYILEGSKAGATAAGVWAAHHVLPLNITGYGRLIGASIEGAQRMYNLVQNVTRFEINGTKMRFETLIKPDFNMVDFAFNIEGNKDLEKMNQLNLDLYNLSSYVSGPVYKDDFITSHTKLDYEDYRDAPRELAGRLGIPQEEWDKVHSLRVMRACVLTPYFINDNVTANYWQKYVESMKGKLEQLIPKFK
ncbi:MAG: tyrosine decarboxylase [Candidatus Cloacimonetes bacterium]|nr:tyrosine decarboxylase [Candidatus Cloacimonadota bacterium]